MKKTKVRKAQEKEIEAMKSRSRMLAECRPDCRDQLVRRLAWSDATTLCKFCRRPAGVDKTCDGCWEVTSRLSGFLRDGGAAAVKALQDALHEVSR